MANAPRDNNRIPVVLGTSNADGSTPLAAYVDSSTNRWLVSATTDIGQTEDTAHQTGDTGVMVLAVRQDTQSDFGADGDYVPLSINASGELRVTTAAGTEYTEDAAAPATVTGNSLLMVRDDALSAVTPIEGDWIRLRGTAEGALWVQDFNSDAVKTAVELIDDAIVADDAAFTPATTKVMMAGFEHDDTTPDSVDEGDAGAARMSSNRNIYTQIRDAAGNERGANVNANSRLEISIEEDNVGIGGGTEYTEDVATPSPIVGSAVMMERDDALSTLTPVEGDWVALRSTAEGALWVEDFNSDAIKTAVELIDDAIVADDAAFTPGTTKVMMAGFEFDDTTPDSVDEGDSGAARMSSRREVYVQIRDAAGNERGLNVDASGDIGVTASQLDIDDLAATSDTVGAALDTSQIMNGTTSLTPKYAVIDEATSGDNTLVAAVTDKKIRVLACFMVAAGDVTARFEDGAGGTALSGQMNLTTNSGFTLPFNPVGWFETSASTLLNLELSTAVSVDGSLVYVEV